MVIVHDFELDVRGEACPYPLIRANKVGNKLLAVELDGGTYNIFVRKG